ncbi:MAG: AsnC family transcriptional regulator [Aestuariivita sp.]|nr:AsnC family transcriptional regulator [Aestuariivita sp.]
MLDDLDRRLLRYLQLDPATSVADLAEIACSTPAVVSRRLTRFRNDGMVLGKEVLIDWSKLGYSVEVSLRITLDKTQSRSFDYFLVAARAVPQIIEIQTFLGRVDVRLSVIAKDMSDYQMVYRDLILTLPHIADIEALMHIMRIKSDEVLPV